MAMTPSDLDEIRKRCEEDGEPGRVVAMATTELIALLDEVERLQTEYSYERDHSAMLSQSNSALYVEKAAVEAYCAKVRNEVTALMRERDALQSRLALLEPVWEAAKRWSEIDHGADDRDDWCDENCPKRQAEDILYAFVVGAIDKEQAIDAAVAKEGR